MTLAALSAQADDWTQPTPEELKMTVEPAAPGATVTCLGMVSVDDYSHKRTHTLYVRLKVLNEDGRSYGDVELPYSEDLVLKTIEARVVHADGNAIVFSGEPYDKLIEKGKHSERRSKVITLPDGQVGSILEYRIVYDISGQVGWYPEWFVQRRFFIRKAHYEYAPDDFNFLIPRYFSVLPKGVDVRFDPKRKLYTLDAENIPALVEEEYEPPMESLSYRVLFYYTDAKSPEDYWRTAGTGWSKGVNEFMTADNLRKIPAQLIHPTDSETEKARALYDAVIAIENTDFTRERSKSEDKADRVKIREAVDVWKARRGNSNELALLFIGLAREAGIKAYAAKIVDRSSSVFMPEYLSTRQLDAFVAILELDGKEVFLDPGEPYCPFGTLSWKHSGTRGLRQTERGTEPVATPSLGYKSSTVARTADISIDASGNIAGTLRLAMTGNEALTWRQRVLLSDEIQAKRDLEESLRKRLPGGLAVSLKELRGASDSSVPLTASCDVHGTLASVAGSRILVPASLFEAENTALFTKKSRVNPVDLEYPYVMQDEVRIHVSSPMAFESLPQDGELALPRNALYKVAFKQDSGMVSSSRLVLLANNLYSADEYPALRDFFQKVAVKDKEQLIVKRSSVAHGGSTEDGTQ
jgi:transglutaminase-like putative cysteine protease